MKGPLHTAIYDSAKPVPSWWEASAPDATPPRPPLEGAIIADVAIIGGGYAGLAAARVLAARGISVAVLDAGAVGWGASGRNGGIVGLGGHKASEATLVKRHGLAEVTRYYSAVVGGLETMRAFCRDNGLSAHMQEGGELWLAHSPGSATALAKQHWPEGVEVVPLPPSGLNDIAQYGGVLMGNAFGIHPLHLVRALAAATEAAGARLFPRSEVLTWARDGAAHRLATAGGSVTAAKVLVATNGFAPEGLHPVSTGRAIPVLSNIGVTRPLTPEEQARHGWLGGDMTAADTRHLLAYFRLLPADADGARRFLFGMRGDSFGSPNGELRMRRALRARLDAAFPGWKGAEITHFWRGPVCMTARLTPSVGLMSEDPSIAHAFGWHGSGINMANLSGRLIGAVLAGDPEETIPAPMRGLAPALPFPALRPLYVGAMRQVYAVQDRLG